jgi:hydroxymethylbilane synthase
MRDIRGNVDTRLQKLASGNYDALVLAQAGLVRLGLEAHITHVFEHDVLLPAPGQGALAIEIRTDDAETHAAVSRLDHAASHEAVDAERGLLAALGGGCLAPVGALAWEDNGLLRLDAAVLSADGRERMAATGTAPRGGALRLAADVAARLVAQGAERLIAQAHPPK